jgi:hypothetical protein
MLQPPLRHLRRLLRFFSGAAATSSIAGVPAPAARATALPAPYQGRSLAGPVDGLGLPLPPSRAPLFPVVGAPPRFALASPPPARAHLLWSTPAFSPDPAHRARRLGGGTAPRCAAGRVVPPRAPGRWLRGFVPQRGRAGHAGRVVGLAALAAHVDGGACDGGSARVGAVHAAAG